LYESRDLQQITDYATAARAMKVPLWVFIRVNTNIDSEFRRIVSTTGGAVVPYFTVPGWEDPIDQAAQTGLIGSMIVLGIGGVVGVLVRGRPNRRSTPEQLAPKTPRDPLGKAVDSIDSLQKFTKASKDRAKDRLD
jgi:hypothetical protein